MGRVVNPLTEFLLARIAEDKRVVLEEDFGGAIPDEWPWDLPRGLAECRAKHHIVGWFDIFDGTAYDGWTNAAAIVLKELASIYADHPDYREEWKP